MVVALLCCALAGPAAAEEPEPCPRPLAVVASVVPGVLLHGSGHWVAGDKKTAKRLLTWQGIGMGLAALGGITIGVTGGAEEAMPGLVLLVPGGGLVVASWLADIYGAAVGSRIGGKAERDPPRVDVELGYAYAHDPQFAYSHLATMGATARLDRVRVGGTALYGEGLWRARGEAAFRVIDELGVMVAGSDQRYDDDRFASSTIEAALEGRYELARIAPSLDGSFVTGQVGFGAERIRYDVPGMPVDWTSLFLGRFSFGIHLGDGGARHAEVEAYYDHRRDQLTGGLLLPSGANGFVGHLGVIATGYRGRWGLTGGVDVGSAWVARLGLKVRFAGVME